MAKRTEVKLENNPKDTISAVKFLPKTNNFLAASSWDCHLRLYDVNTNVIKADYAHDTPILDFAFHVSFPFFTFFPYHYKQPTHFDAIGTRTLDNR